MNITKTDIATAQVSAITDFAKDICWGRAPFPEGFVPILAVTSIGNSLYGILMRARTTGRFVIGTSGALRSLSEEIAIELMNKADVGDEKWQAGSWGGAREGAGRPKVIPETAKRRSIYLTDDEFEYVKKWVENYREDIKA